MLDKSSWSKWFSTQVINPSHYLFSSLEILESCPLPFQIVSLKLMQSDFQRIPFSLKRPTMPPRIFVHNKPNQTMKRRNPTVLERAQWRKKKFSGVCLSATWFLYLASLAASTSSCGRYSCYFVMESNYGLSDLCFLYVYKDLGSDILLFY